MFERGGRSSCLAFFLLEFFDLACDAAASFGPAGNFILQPCFAPDHLELLLPQLLNGAVLGISQFRNIRCCRRDTADFGFNNIFLRIDLRQLNGFRFAFLSIVGEFFNRTRLLGGQ